MELTKEKDVRVILALKEADDHDSHDMIEAIWLKILAVEVRRLQAELEWYKPLPCGHIVSGGVKIGQGKTAFCSQCDDKKWREQAESERDALREQVKALNESIDKLARLHNATSNSWAEDAAENVELKAKLAAMEDALREALPYVPEHHGPVNHKIKIALSQLDGLEKK